MYKIDEYGILLYFPGVMFLWWNYKDYQ